MNAPKGLVSRDIRGLHMISMNIGGFTFLRFQQKRFKVENEASLFRIWLTLGQSEVFLQGILIQC